ncbi:MAG: ribonuclease P protein component [Gemmatimonadota bacterium]
MNADARRDPGDSPEPPEASAGQRLPRSARIRQTRDIRHLLRRGKRRKTSHFDVFFASREDLQQPRFGLIVPKYRHTGVERNLLKRRLRDVARRELLPRFRASGVSIDVMVRARRDAYGARYRDLKEELVEAAEAICSDPSFWG